MIELLLVIAIIALLSTIVVVAISGARRKARDTKRVNDISEIQKAVELYFINIGHYPIVTTPIILGATDSNCDGGKCSSLSEKNSFAATTSGEVYMGLIPPAPMPVEDGCTAEQNSYNYKSVEGSSYSLSFCLGEDTGNYSKGPHTVTPTNVQ